MLIVAAIVAYMVKNNHHNKLPIIRQSVYVALIASVVTAFIFQLIFENSGQNRELLEGFTMIIAVFMLFSMSYWLLSKVEAQNWKHYLEGKLSTALTAGSLCYLSRRGRNRIVLLCTHWRCQKCGQSRLSFRRLCKRCNFARNLLLHYAL